MRAIYAATAFSMIWLSFDKAYSHFTDDKFRLAGLGICVFMSVLVAALAMGRKHGS